MTSERECIELIKRYAAGQPGGGLVKGIGDDCAVISRDEKTNLLYTTDTLVQGVHFNLNWHPPYLLGRKCAAVNLSDIAAMGGRPRACLLSVSLPEGVPAWFEEFIRGFAAMLQEHETMLIGGDTVKGNQDMVFTVVITGEADKKKTCYRSGAEPGDLVYVSGELGQAAAGLYLCREGISKADDQADKWHQLVRAHLDPEPQVALGKALANSGLVQAMMDISDGLATDLAHICQESGVGAEVRQDLLPVSGTLRQAASELGMDFIDLVLKGGEDYQLLFTVKPGDESQLKQLAAEQGGREIYKIGRITSGEGVYLSSQGKRQEISFQGYDHFVNMK